MSLINEALKRTRNATLFGNMGTPSAPGYQTSAVGSASSFGPRAAIFAFVMSVMLAGVAVTMLVVRLAPSLKAIAMAFDSTVNGKAVDTHSLPATIPAPVIQTPAPAPKPVVAAEPKQTEEELVARVVERIKTDQAAPAPVPVPTPAPQPEPPKLTLQGITSDGHSREAMINGFTVHEGEEIEGARVVSIDPQTVKLQFGDRELLLRIR